MADKITKTQRWLDLIALLLNRQIPLSVEQIMDRVPAYSAAVAGGDEKARASARRMFERDKDELRAAGIPLETVRYEINYGLEIVDGYRITRRDFYLPYLRLISGEGEDRTGEPPERPYLGIADVQVSPAEIAPAFEALGRVADLPGFTFADSARSALRKLAFDIDHDDFAAPPVVRVEQPGAAEVLERLRVLSDALLARKRVGFTYHGIARGEPTERDVAPYGLFYHRDWYLVGHDERRGAVRVFRVARISDPRPNTRAPKQPDYRVPDDFALDDYLDRSAWELGEAEEAVEVDLLFRFPRSIRADRNAEGALVEERPDGSTVRRFTVAQPDPFLRWVLSLQGEAEILRPEHLREELRAMARTALALYDGRSGADD